MLLGRRLHFEKPWVRDAVSPSRSFCSYVFHISEGRVERLRSAQQPQDSPSQRKCSGNGWVAFLWSRYRIVTHMGDSLRHLDENNTWTEGAGADSAKASIPWFSLWGPASQVMTERTPLCIEPRVWVAVIEHRPQISRAHTWAGDRGAEDSIPRLSEPLGASCQQSTFKTPPLPHGRRLPATSSRMTAHP